MIEFIKNNFGYFLGFVFIPFVYPFVSRTVDRIFKRDNKDNERPSNSKNNK